MSVITSDLLRHFYNEAAADIEYKSSEFWQIYLQSEFDDKRTYTVTCEVSPDDSLRRVDIVVKRFDRTHRSVCALLWVECKRPGGSLREVERQALDAARRCIQRDNLLWVYTMTTVGTSCRIWFLERNGRALIPFHGTSHVADWKQYVDADSENAWVIPQSLHMIKDNIPLGKPIILPSQSLDDLQPQSQGAFGYLPAQNQRQDESSGGPSYSRQGPRQPSSSPERVSSKDSSNQRDQVVPVKVRKEVHSFSSDKYFFKDVKGKTKETTKKDWVLHKDGGRRAWLYHGKRVVYLSDIEIT